ncbi:autophagy protein 13 [Tieghemiomyces parasiticus]|uniref:Autophagy-related protein 13 n=1 Tax=Tieghemiomyces parasiticus TaxID=78921 RepID=A0A9W8A6D6_9FUNG|nr:autophagy protein 13 [Tieghemiomyces parasiticus]
MQSPPRGTTAYPSHLPVSDTDSLPSSSQHMPARDNRGEQITQNVFAKFAQIVVRSRYDTDDTVHDLAPPSSRTNKWFNLETEDTEAVRTEAKFWRTACLLSAPPPPMFIEVYLDLSCLTDRQTLVVTDDRLRRWMVDRHGPNLHDSRTSLHAAVTGYPPGQPSPQSLGSTSQGYTTVLLESWQLQLGHMPPYPAPDLPVVYKKAVVFFRGLFSLVRLLPAYRLSQRLHSGDGSATPLLRLGYRFGTEPAHLGHEIRLDTGLTGSLDPTQTFTFDPLVTTLGTFSGGVTYRTGCQFHVEEPDINPLPTDPNPYFSPTLITRLGNTSSEQLVHSPFRIPAPGRAALPTPSPLLPPLHRRTSSNSSNSYRSATAGQVASLYRRSSTTTASRPVSGGPMAAPSATAPLASIHEVRASTLPHPPHTVVLDRVIPAQLPPHRPGFHTGQPVSSATTTHPNPRLPSSFESRHSSLVSNPSGSYGRESRPRPTSGVIPPSAVAAGSAAGSVASSVFRRPSLSLVSPFKSPSLSASPASPFPQGMLHSSSHETDASGMSQRSRRPLSFGQPSAGRGPAGAAPYSHSGGDGSTGGGDGLESVPGAYAESIGQSPRLSSSFARRHRATVPPGDVNTTAGGGRDLHSQTAPPPHSPISPGGVSRSQASSHSPATTYRPIPGQRRQSLLSDYGDSVSDVSLTSNPPRVSVGGLPGTSGHAARSSLDRVAPTLAATDASPSALITEDDGIAEFQRILETQSRLKVVVSHAVTSAAAPATVVSPAAGVSPYTVDRDLDRMRRLRQSYNFMADSIAQNARPSAPAMAADLYSTLPSPPLPPVAEYTGYYAADPHVGRATSVPAPYSVDRRPSRRVPTAHIYPRGDETDGEVEDDEADDDDNRVVRASPRPARGHASRRATYTSPAFPLSDPSSTTPRPFQPAVDDQRSPYLTRHSSVIGGRSPVPGHHPAIPVTTTATLGSGRQGFTSERTLLEADIAHLRRVDTSQAKFNYAHGSYRPVTSPPMTMVTDHSAPKHYPTAAHCPPSRDSPGSTETGTTGQSARHYRSHRPHHHHSQQRTGTTDTPENEDAESLLFAMSESSLNESMQ